MPSVHRAARLGYYGEKRPTNVSIGKMKLCKFLAGTISSPLQSLTNLQNVPCGVDGRERCYKTNAAARLWVVGGKG